MPTTNPVPSTDPSDLLFNAGRLDEVVNGTASSFTDRLGVARRTVAGMNADFDAQLADAESDLNVYRADAAASAAEALGYLQTIRATSYGAYAEDPTTDPLGNPPTVGDEYFNTTANLLKRWNGTIWQASDINTANLAASSGSSLVGYDGGTVQDVLDGAVSKADYAALRAYSGRATRIYITGLLITAKPAGIAGVFQYDPTDTTSSDNGGTIIVGADGRRWKRDYSGNVSVKWFGALGDGMTYDTAAFVAANAYIMTKQLPYTNQTVESQYVTLEIPEGIYKISGHRIFGSQIPTGSNGTTPPRMLRVIGQGASLIWDVQNEDDELFYFDGTIAAPEVSGISVYIARSSIIPTGAGVIFRFYSNPAISNQVNASKFHLTNFHVWPGRYTSGAPGQRPKCVFLNTGNAMCDQMLIENCRFNYMQKVWMGQNSQAVNITFSSCSFFAATNGTITGVTYFDFESMDDNFNVENCSFSVTKGETLIRTNSPVSNGTYTGTAGFNFNFRDNRFELISSVAGAWTLCNMNFGTLNFSGTNFGLGSGAGVTPTFVRAFGLANLNFKDVKFNTAYFYFPVSNTFSAGKILPVFGAYLDGCQFDPNAAFFKFYDGTAEYTLQNAFTSSVLWRSVKFKDCVVSKSGDFLNWAFINARLQYSESPVAGRRVERVTYSRAGVALQFPFKLPPFQVIRKISISMPGTLPDTYDAFRVWIGDRSLGNYFDVDNVRPDVRKTDFVLFEGTASVFNSSESLQTIEVTVLNSGVESGGISSEITVDYEAADFAAIGINTSADQIKMTRTSRSLNSGTTAQRPNIDLYINQQYFDTTLNKPIWYNGSVWKDAAGTTV